MIRDIFNADNTGLFYWCTQDITLDFNEKRCSGGKQSNEQITLLIGAYMNGIEQFPLLMIGKSANSKRFKNIKSKSTVYQANTKASMTSEVFRKWQI